MIFSSFTELFFCQDVPISSAVSIPDCCVVGKLTAFLYSNDPLLLFMTSDPALSCIPRNSNVPFVNYSLSCLPLVLVCIILYSPCFPLYCHVFPCTPMYAPVFPGIPLYSLESPVLIYITSCSARYLTVTKLLGEHTMY